MMTLAATVDGADADDLTARLRAGDRRALATAMTEVEHASPTGEAVLIRLRSSDAAPSFVVGITGPPGAGKSTLVARLIAELTGAGRRVGALLIDPSSRVSGGAVLGDRIRLGAHGSSSSAFVRSVGSRGALGGTASSAAQLAELLAAWGAELVLIETVGAGQADVAIADLADCTVLVLPPGLGDELQAIKAGLMEIADLFVINKADRAGADEAAAALRSANRGAAPGAARPTFRTVATTGDGVDDLAHELLRRREAER